MIAAYAKAAGADSDTAHLPHCTDYQARGRMSPSRRLALTLVAFVLGISSLIAGHQESRAWSASWSDGTTLWAFNWDYFQPGIFPWTANSTTSYTMVWNPDYYTRIDYLVHESYTDSNWTDPIIKPYLTATISTTYYSDSWYLFSFGWLNGGCWGGSWSVWFCDAGSVDINVYGSASAYVNAHVAIGGGGWYMTGGGSSSGWYYW